MASFSSELASLEAGGGNANDRAAGYNSLLQRIMKTADNLESNMVRYVQSITSDSIGVIHSRPLLSAFNEQFRALNNNVAKTESG